MPDLLIELFSEEIPARMQTRAAEDLRKRVTDGLVEAGLTYAHAAAFSTPRRLTLTVEGLLAASPTTREERKGPRTDAPDKAVEGFLRSTGLTRDQLVAREDKKGQVWFAVIEKPGRPAAQIVAETLETTIRNFPWPKSMRWGAGTLRWVRPLHAILCILYDEAGASTVPLSIDGITASALTRGHRFMAPDAIAVSSFEDYEARLKRARVLLRPQEREDHIWTDAHNLAFAQGLEVVEDKGLLAEVAGLVEYPVALMGEIGPDFLGLPAEVLQTSMREHQKFFSVRNPKTARIEKFITVANIETADHGATILAGNQKVLSARLSDAKFFWENDLRTVQREGMTGMAAPLAKVTFHNKLGSQADRIARIAALAREIAPMVGAKPDLAEEAARIAKADLASEMVYEFPELQGIMGKYYAQAAGHDDGVPEACEMHYKPLGPSDEVPTHPVSVAVALADKIDTLTGFWAIDEKPTGSKDPYALRRAALGVIRLELVNGTRLNFSRLLRVSLARHIVPTGYMLALENSIAEQPLEFSVHVLQELEHTGAYGRFQMSGMDFAEKEIVSGWLQGNDKPPISDLEVSNIASGYEGRDASSVRKTIVSWFDRLYDAESIYHNNRNLDGLHSRDAAINREDSALFAYVSEMFSDLLAFFHDRLKVHLRDEGIRHDVIDACLAMPNNDDLTLLVKRAQALSHFLKSDDGPNLLLGFKRANTLLTQAEDADGVEYSYGADPKFADDPTEHALFAALDTAGAQIRPAMDAEDFEKAMHAMASLRAPIDAFFDTVQVNTDNSVLRRNRLNLLHRIREICLSVADLTRVEG